MVKVRKRSNIRVFVKYHGNLNENVKNDKYRRNHFVESLYTQHFQINHISLFLVLPLHQPMSQ